MPGEAEGMILREGKQDTIHGLEDGDAELGGKNLQNIQSLYLAQP